MSDKVEHDEIRSVARAVLDDICGPSAVRQRIASRLDDPAAELPDPCWEAMAGLGWAGITIGEEHGGAGASFTELAVILEELGGHLAGSAVFATAVLGATALNFSEQTELRARTLAEVAAGKTRVTVTLTQPCAAPLTAEPDGTGWQVHGAAEMVMAATEADVILLSAYTRDGEAVLLSADASAPGLLRVPTPMLDLPRSFGRVKLAGVRLGAERLLARGERAEWVLARVGDSAWTGIACDSVGAGAAMLERTISYVGQRTQFGRPVGSFQAVKHKCADMFLQLETARVIAEAAAGLVAGHEAEASLRASQGKLYACDAAAALIGTSVQMHGGIGMTWEHDVHLYLKRAVLNQSLWGSSRWHARRVADLTLPKNAYE